MDLVFLSTIPGTIGGAVRMNAGCYGCCAGDRLAQVRVVMRDGRIRTFSTPELGLGYRNSNLPADAVVTEATFAPEIGDPAAFRERILRQRKRRKETQPQGAGTAGSAFRNPGGRPSHGPEDAGHATAWRLIDAAGMRGARLGGARVSEMHPNFLVNADRATAADIEGLGERVRAEVRHRCGVALDWEIARIGRPGQPDRRLAKAGRPTGGLDRSEAER